MHIFKLLNKVVVEYKLLFTVLEILIKKSSRIALTFLGNEIFVEFRLCQVVPKLVVWLYRIWVQEEKS
jgi:hypothetical protein